jgi:hypothetical protein
MIIFSFHHPLIITDSRSNICFAIQMHEGALYLGVDVWQLPNGYNIIGTVVYQLVDDGSGNTNLDAMPLDFVQLNKVHTGKYLACILLES